MHDSEQEHSGITGCRVTYESTIFYNEANKFSIIVVKTSDPRIPPQACSGRYYGDRMLRFTAVGYELPRTKAVELELDGEWVESKYGYQLQVEQWQEIVPQTADGLLAYLGSGLIKGIGPKTAEDIVATFGPDTLNILDNEPEKLLQIRGITEGKLKDIEESYAESRVLRNLMSLLGPFKITPATALKIYQNFGPACVDILKKCPYDLCQISGFGFKRVDGIVRKTDNRLHSAERIKGALVGAGLFTAIMLLTIGIMAWSFCVDPQDVPPLPLLVVDMGTATTMSVINEKEEFIGGAIMPGLRLSLEALSSKASLLPHIDLIPPKSVIGRNTVDAMDSGIIYGAASMLDGMIDRIQQELGQPVQAVATGGLSKNVTPNCRHSIIQDPNLLLKGLRILYYKNVK